MKNKLTLTTLTAVAGFAAVANAQILINEMRPNPPGSDPANELVELIALGGETSFSGFWQSLESDNSTWDVQNSGSFSVTFDANGLATFDTGNIENPAFTFFISSVDYSSATGLADIAVANVLDAVGVRDSNSSDTMYGASLGGIDLGYSGDEPQNIFRDSISLSWFQVNDDGPPATIADQSGTIITDLSAFDINPSTTTSTFGGVNPTAIPEPGAFALHFGLLGLIWALRRRRRA